MWLTLKRCASLRTQAACAGILNGFQKDRYVQLRIQADRISQVVLTLSDDTSSVTEPRACTIINSAISNKLFVGKNDDIFDIELEEQDKCTVAFEMRKGDSDAAEWASFSEPAAFKKYIEEIFERTGCAPKTFWHSVYKRDDHVVRKVVAPIVCKDVLYPLSGQKSIQIKCVRSSGDPPEPAFDIIRLTKPQPFVLHKVWSVGMTQQGWQGGFALPYGVFLSLSDSHWAKARERWLQDDVRLNQDNGVKLSKQWKVQGSGPGTTMPAAQAALHAVGWNVVPLRCFQRNGLTVCVVASEQDPPQNKNLTNLRSLLISANVVSPKPREKMLLMLRQRMSIPFLPGAGRRNKKSRLHQIKLLRGPTMPMLLWVKGLVLSGKGWAALRLSRKVHEKLFMNRTRPRRRASIPSLQPPRFQADPLLLGRFFAYFEPAYEAAPPVLTIASVSGSECLKFFGHFKIKRTLKLLGMISGKLKSSKVFLFLFFFTNLLKQQEYGQPLSNLFPSRLSPKVKMIGSLILHVPLLFLRFFIFIGLQPGWGTFLHGFLMVAPASLLGGLSTWSAVESEIGLSFELFESELFKIEARMVIFHRPLQMFWLADALVLPGSVSRVKASGVSFADDTKIWAKLGDLPAFIQATQELFSFDTSDGPEWQKIVCSH